MINKDTIIGTIILTKPNLISTLVINGMHCVGCPASYTERLEDACIIHSVDLNYMINELNRKDSD